MSSALVAKFAEKFSVDQSQVVSTLKNTCFKGQVNDAQMTALMIVADQYGLNPFTKEIYAFPDKNNGIVPVVGVDGWSRIINEHPAFDGIEFNEGGDGVLPDWIECVIHRKDRAHPVKLREYMAECKRAAGPWQSHPRRMLRHKAMIQCARLAFGYVGIFDHDEAERIIEAPKDMGKADVVQAEEFDVKPFIDGIMATKTSEDAGKYWQENIGLMKDHPEAHKEFKAATIKHGEVLKKFEALRNAQSITYAGVTQIDEDEYVPE